MEKKISVFLLLSGLTALLTTGCIKHPDAPGPDRGWDGADGFDYATVAEVKIDIDYSMKGNKALFEVFAENPVVEREGRWVRKDGVKSLLKAYTDGECRYSGKLGLPAAAGTVYLYSETYGLPVCIGVDVTADGVSFDLLDYYRKLRERNSDQTAMSASGPTRAASADNPYNIRTLGKWTLEGLPLYIFGKLSPAGDNIMPDFAKTPSGLMNRIQNVLLPGADNSNYAKPAEVVNLNVTKDARLTLVFAAELAAWHNAIGYYFYDTRNPPRTQAEFDALPKYVAFPNCSSYTTNFDDPEDFGSSSNDGKAALLFGEQMRLRYFKDGKATDVFPQGTTVGWFLLPDAYDFSYLTYKWSLDLTGSKHAVRYSNDEFNEGNGRYMVSLYDKASGKTVLGFEDGGDNDYKDVLFYVDADPADAIYDPDRPTTDPDDEKYPDVVGDPLEGTLAFEDLWPSQGDYDMNDVVVRYSKTFTTDKNNRLLAVKDVFTPLHSGGALRSAFGYQLDVPAASVKSVSIDNASTAADGMEAGQSKPTFMLFDDIRQAIGRGSVTVTVTLDGSLSLEDVTGKSLYNPFICVSDNGFEPGRTRKEVHLTNYAPTDLADPYPYGKFDDKSSVDKQGNPTGPYYYVTSDLHPFAIDLPVTEYRIPDESVKIDDFYPDFTGWVLSKGEKYREWYLKPAK